MNTILIIFNGIKLPYHVIDHAIDRAKTNAAEISGLFLKGTSEPSKGYGYPSDLPTTETWVSEEKAVSDDEKLISENMHLVKQMITDEKIPYHSALKTNATIDEIAAIAATAVLVVIDKNFDELSLLSDDKISLKMLEDKVSKPIDVV